MINNKTKIFISIGTNPGNTGTFVYNSFFKKKKFNAIYKSFKIEKLYDLVKSIKTLKIDGFSVAMPYKSKIIPMLDRVESIAKSTNSVNTVLHKKGKLIGYNTDVLGINAALKKYKIKKTHKILIIGLGGAASSTLFALTKIHKLKNIFVTNRSKKKIKNLKKIGKFTFLENLNKTNLNFDVIINCSPIGMDNFKKIIPIPQKFVENSSFIIDFVNKPSNTKLIQLAKQNNIKYSTGDYISINQIYNQIGIYLGKKIDYKDVSSIFKLYERN